MVNLEIIGIHSIEKPGFVIDRSKGSGNYLFLLFHTDIYIQRSGRLRHYPEGTMILYTPGQAQYYANPSKGFDNDWIHFTSSTYDTLIPSLNLPMNTPFSVTDPALAHNFLLNIEKEHLMKNIGATMMIDHLTNQLFIHLSRLYNQPQSQTLSYGTQNVENQFREIRSTILSQLATPWHLESMAALANLSRSRFCTLYKGIFNISPKEDLLNERFTMAKYLLRSTQQPIGEIAEKVGYMNIYQFSKQFKKISGCSPTNYRTRV